MSQPILRETLVAACLHWAQQLTDSPDYLFPHSALLAGLPAIMRNRPVDGQFTITITLPDENVIKNITISGQVPV